MFKALKISTEMFVMTISLMACLIQTFGCAVCPLPDYISMPQNNGFSGFFKWSEIEMVELFNLSHLKTVETTWPLPLMGVVHQLVQ